MSAVELNVEDAGEGVPVVLMHGLTATHRYVVMGSRALERSGHRVIAYDARGHGASAAAVSPDDYGYGALASDLLHVMAERGIERAVLAGASMGAHTALAVALEDPDRVAGLVVITPAYDPSLEFGGARLERWDALSDGLREGGVEGFVAAYGEPAGDPAWRETILRVIRQRLAEHENPRAVADALRTVPRSRPFGVLAELSAISVPVTVVASRDEPDPGHPLAVGEAYSQAIPGARLVVEPAGKSPIAWQGGQLSAVIAQLAQEARL